MKCIYVAVGQKNSSVAQTVRVLEEFGAFEYTVVVVASAGDPAPFKFLAPYAGCAMGQHWMEHGEHALIVYDDLSKQAEAYRQISLLLRRPPGREAYPGDVFYLHSRLLERAAKLSDELGGGLAHRAADHRDQGRRHLGVHPDQRDLDHRRPDLLAVRPLLLGRAPGDRRGQLGVARRQRGASSRRCGPSRARLKIDLAQFRDLESFATFGSELDKASQAQLDRGYRLDRAAEAAAQRAGARRRAGHRDLRGDQGLGRHGAGRPRCGASSPSCSRSSAPSTPSCSPRSATPARCPRPTTLDAALTTFLAGFDTTV